ncbi:MFS transporter permease [Microbacterium capsulatum]|uniref:MFS transporter permease n=1 Tax=Microbacterium capsulatum TaxID=3041921 RepID=A0ABU0XF59_9MICO|nr:MFS transporter permease [Microbacterium sp. ASV81]MDQ4213258.1 MFS transporter permease [Microbacterium sp. ASV81]
MWIRRAFFSWLFPAAVVLPLWLLVGWGVFQSGGWAFLWVLFIAMPSVLLGELAIAFLVRARATVRAARAVSWQDVGGIAIWHALTIAVGFFPGAFGWILTGAIVAFLGVFWSTLWQLGRESAAAIRRAMDPDPAGRTTSAPAEPVDPSRAPMRGRVIVINESPAPGGGART